MSFKNDASAGVCWNKQISFLITFCVGKFNDVET